MSTRYQAVQEQLKRQPRTWLLSGAAGFIGSNLLQKLLQLGQKVVGIDNFATGSRSNLDDVQQSVGEEAWRRFRFLEADICSADDCQRACNGVDYVLHQAALGSVPRSIKNPRATHDANVTGFINMMNAARDSRAQRMVYASSSSVYGDHPGLPKVEDKIGTVLSPYAASKYADEIYADAFSSCYSLSIAGLRYFNVFGPRQDPAGAYAAVIPKWIGKLLRNEQCEIFGDGETSRDFTYIENVVQANLLAAIPERTQQSRVFNVACGEALTLTALYDVILKAICKNNPGYKPTPPIHRDFRQGDVRHSLADLQRIRTELGYQPTHLAAQGLAETVHWYMKRSGQG